MVRLFMSLAVHRSARPNRIRQFPGKPRTCYAVNLAGGRTRISCSIAPAVKKPDQAGIAGYEP